MPTDLSTYRSSPAEQERIADLFALLPSSGALALDIGARDGFLAMKLAERFDEVVALDLDKPEIDHPDIEPVQGNVTDLEFAENQFDAILCAEVLEHIPEHLLARACHEIARVARNKVVVGVPYRQDLRCGRTTCNICGRTNPPWGHVNSFDEDRLRSLFPTLILKGQRLWESVPTQPTGSLKLFSTTPAILSVRGNRTNPVSTVAHRLAVRKRGVSRSASPRALHSC